MIPNQQSQFLMRKNVFCQSKVSMRSTTNKLIKICFFFTSLSFSWKTGFRRWMSLVCLPFGAVWLERDSSMTQLGVIFSKWKRHPQILYKLFKKQILESLIFETQIDLPRVLILGSPLKQDVFPWPRCWDVPWSGSFLFFCCFACWCKMKEVSK